MHPFPARARRPRHAFTLLELMTVMVIITILVVVLLPVISYLRSRAEKTRCLTNLRSLHVAASSYIQDHNQWPQVITKNAAATDIATAWINILHPYGLEQSNWICPTMQSALGAPDLTQPENARVDYAANPFDTNRQSPFKYTRQPWFIESGNVHGNGAEIIFFDGHIEEANDIIRAAQSAASPGSTKH